jgi:hypothetical protein
MDDYSFLNTKEKQEAFKFYEIHGLVRHLKDCIQICNDLIESENVYPFICSNDVRHMKLEFSLWHEVLVEHVPFVDKWIKVENSTTERTKDAPSCPDCSDKPHNGGCNQAQADCRRSPKIT